MQKNNNRCFVSVVITVFQRTKFLRTAIESALAQERPADEIIVTDDSDSTEIRAICESFPAGQVRYRSNSPALGVAGNVRIAAEESQGDLIAILNDDDIWEPDLLAMLVPPLEKSPEIVLSFGDHWLMDADGTTDETASVKNTALYKREHLPTGRIADPSPLVIVHNSIPMAMAAVFRKDAVDWTRLALDVRGAYDFWLSCLLARTGRPFYYTNRRLSRYRLHHEMETARQAADKNENMAFIYGTLLRENSFPPLRPFLRHKLAVTLRTCGRDQLRFGSHTAARARFQQSISTRITAKSVAGWLLSWLP